MNWESIDWKALERLRAAFLEGTAGERDYWQNESVVASYDATFAQRIGWKWDYVLKELKRRGWTPPAGELLDWGCGSGIAHRAFLDHFGVNSISNLRLWDRSPVAMKYASDKAKARFPKSNIQNGLKEELTFSTILLSHVLTELDERQTNELLSLANKTQTVIWVEPGTYEASRRLIAIREKCKALFNIVAPCTHQSVCGMLTSENERHWCHHFAAPPPEVFTDSHWVRFGKLAGVDLRSLPVSFLVLDKRPLPALPPGATRIIGHPRIYKPYATVFGCDAEGVRERRLSKRNLPDEFRKLKKEETDVLQIWKTEGEEVVETAPLFNQT